MANPFYVQPASGIGPGLAGIGEVVAETRAMRAQQQAQEAAQAEIAQALDSGDPDLINAAALKYPQISDAIYKAMEINDDARKAALATDLREMITSPPEQIPAIFERRIADIEASGGDPSHTVQAYQEYLENPEQELARMRLIYPSLVSSQEYEEFKRMQQPEDGKSMQRVSAIVGDEERPTSLNYDPSTGIYSRQMPDGTVEEIPSSMVTQVSIQGAAGDVLPPARIDTLAAERDWLQFQRDDLARMTDLLRQNPTLGGAAGSLRRIGQIATGTAQDLGALFGNEGAQAASNFMFDTVNRAAEEMERGNLSEDQFNALFNDPALSELALFENTLGFTLARLRVPDGRLLASVVERSMDDAKITGLTTSSQDVINKFEAIQRQLDARLESMNRRIGDQSPSQDSGDTSTMTIEELVEFYSGGR